MELFASYYIRVNDQKKYLHPGKMLLIQEEPRTGSIVTVDGVRYEILGAKYDHELYRAFGDKIYAVSLKRI